MIEEIGGGGGLIFFSLCGAVCASADAVQGQRFGVQVGPDRLECSEVK